MQLEFTYTLDDLREATIPPVHAGNIRKYRRRWIPASISLGLALIAIALLVSAYRMAPHPVEPPENLLLEVLPPGIPAALLMCVLAYPLGRSWRRSRVPPDPQQDSTTQTSRHMRWYVVALGVTLGIVLFWLLHAMPQLQWQPTKAELVLIRVAPWVILLAMLIVMGTLQQRWNAREKWLMQPSWRRPKVVTLNEGGYQTSDPVIRLSIAWAGFARARETENLLILIGFDDLQYLIPKRAFADENEVARCRALIQRFLPRTQFLVKPGGFAVLPMPVLPLETTSQAGSETSSLTPPPEAMTIAPNTETEPPT